MSSIRIDTPPERSLLKLALALALLVAALAAPATLAQEEQPGIFGDVIDVRVVNLEVVVTDRQGNRVVGLAPGDFRLKVDGEERPIAFFTEVENGLARETAAGGAAVAPAAGDLEVGQAVGTSYLVFIDDFFPLQRDRNFVLEGLTRQLGNLRPEDRMAIVAFDGRRLEMLSSWSSSSDQLERAFRQARGRPTYGLQRRAELGRLRSSQNLGAFEQVIPDVGVRLTPEEREHAILVSGQVQRMIDGAAAAVRGFAAPPGRKVMVLLSGGWPFDSTQIATASSNKPVLDGDIDRGDLVFKPLADMANLFGYTLYPVDVPGLQYSGPEVGAEGLPGSVATVNANSSGDSGGNRLPGTGAIAPGFPSSDPNAGQVAPDPGVVLAEEHELQAGIGILANRTGGKALLNSRRFRALEAIAEDTRSYYWLGFNAQRQGDNLAHKIEIEVLNPKLRVRSRKSFLDLSRTAEVNAMVESTLLFGSSPSTGALPIQLGAIQRSGRRYVEVPLTVAIPVEMMTLLQAGGDLVSELELRIAVMDESGNQAEIPVVALRLASGEQPRQDGFVRYDTSFRMRRSKHDVVVAVFDPATGRLASNRIEVAP